MATPFDSPSSKTMPTNPTLENTTCQPPMQLRVPPSGRHWLAARWALKVLARHGDDAAALREASRWVMTSEEAPHALEVVSVYMAAHGHPMEGFAALSCSLAWHGRFITRDLKATAELALNGFRFFDTGLTITAEGVAA